MGMRNHNIIRLNGLLKYLNVIYDLFSHSVLFIIYILYLQFPGYLTQMSQLIVKIVTLSRRTAESTLSLWSFRP